MSSGGQTAPQPGAANVQSEPWFVRSRFYDPVCMSPVILQDIQSRLGFANAPLNWLETTGKDIGFRTINTVATPENRRQAQTDLESTSPDARVFFLEHAFQHLAQGVMRFSIGLSADTLSWFLLYQEIHPMFLESLHSQGQCALYETFGQDGKLTHIHICVKLTPAGHLEAAFYIRFDIVTKRTVAIVAGNDLDSHLRILGDHFQRNGPPRNPFAFASLLVTRYLRFLENQTTQIAHAVIMTERETGRGAVAYSGGQATQIIEPDKFDLTRMYWLEGNQRNMVVAANAQVKLAVFLIEEHIQFIKQRNSFQFDRHQLSEVEKPVYERLKSHKSLVEGLLAGTLTMQERIQQQLSAVDSIINQSDNKVGLSNAAANTKIAEQSKRIAEETRRDSTSMKTIASLTMVYLPSTFAATVFGTGFFTYREGDEMVLRVNSQIWQLIVTALVLSALTVGIWIGINKYGIPRHLSWARTDVKNLEDGAIPLQVLSSNGAGRPPITIVSNPSITLPAPSRNVA